MKSNVPYAVFIGDTQIKTGSWYRTQPLMQDQVLKIKFKFLNADEVTVEEIPYTLSPGVSKTFTLEITAPLPVLEWVGNEPNPTLGAPHVWCKALV